jgi:ketosteroid isomerase-like protein
MLVANNSTTQIVRAYYDTWQNGMGSFDAGRLRDLLAPDFVYDGPIAGRRVGPESFVVGLGRFVNTLKSMRMLQQLQVGDESAAVYDCDLTSPAGTFRFAEFLRVRNGKIQEITLVFDATRFR